MCATLVILTGVANIRGRANSYAVSPLDYRNWTHVKSALVDPKKVSDMPRPEAGSLRSSPATTTPIRY